MASSGTAVTRAAPGRSWTLWSLVAAFGAYFCMYAYRKPFTASSYSEPVLGGVDFKTILITAQVAGYMLSKFIGIKVVAELAPSRRAWTILALIALAEVALFLFAVLPPPWSALCLFLNGLPLGMVFGFVLGFLEGRVQTELLAAGLCASFILADGVAKSLGAQLLVMGVAEHWMPFAAGLLAAPALVLFVLMLARIPSPGHVDIAARAERATMNRAERRLLYARYALGLTLIVVMYLLVTVVRSIRADFALEIWQGLGTVTDAETFTYSEILVALGVLGVCGATVLIRDNRLAFFVSLATCTVGLALIALTLVCRHLALLSPFAFMVLIGVGLYLPYVAVQTTVFERLMAMTRERGTTGFLIYVADAFGYLGYVAVMLGKRVVTDTNNVLPYFEAACWSAAAFSLVGMIFAWRYFSRRCPAYLKS
ncbi:MAG TPA: DUF5690 family protein [Gemmataceae bacterium]|nr:DUF5690 family protein [Gemmataceae bacterium]